MRVVVKAWPQRPDAVLTGIVAMVAGPPGNKVELIALHTKGCPTPIGVGYFDTYPDNDDPGYAGAWNAYPFFPSRTVIVSDRAGGLFVLNASALLPCAGDANGDGVVDPLDSGFVPARFGPCP